jgi:hypothetical protein
MPVRSDQLPHDRNGERRARGRDDEAPGTETTSAVGGGQPDQAIVAGVVRTLAKAGWCPDGSRARAE